MWAANLLSKKTPFYVVTLRIWFVQGVLNLKRTTLVLSSQKHVLCFQEICVLYGGTGTIFYTENTVLASKKVSIEQADGPVVEVLLEDSSWDHFWEKQPLWKSSSASHCFQFFTPPEAPVCSATQGLLVKKVFVQMFHVHTHPPMGMHAYTRTWPCMHTTVKEERKSAILRAEKMMDTVRTQPIRSENYSLAYED